MEKPVNEQLQDLITVYGVDHCLAACRAIVEKYGQLVAPESKLQVNIDLVPHLLSDIETTFDGITQNAFAVVGRLEKLQAAKAKGVPAEYFKILGPEGLDYTFTALDSAVSSQLEAGNKREAAHRDRSDLVRRRAQLETSIKLTEAEAIMNIVGTGKDAYVMVGEKMTYMPNDTARDAYRRTVSKVEREELAKVNGEIAAIEADIVRAKDGWDTAKEASDTLRAMANAQAALLNFLASRG